MAALHSLLALYGAFDQSIIEANNPEWTARVEQFLPGTTGLNQRGWFSELQNLVNRLAPNPALARFPTVAEAVAELTAVAEAISGIGQPATSTERLNQLLPELSRLSTELSRQRRGRRTEPLSEELGNAVEMAGLAAELAAVATVLAGLTAEQSNATEPPSPAGAGPGGAGGAFTGPPISQPPLLTTTDVAQVLYIFAVGNKLADAAPQTSVDFSAFRDANNLNAIYGLAGEPPSTIYGRGGSFSPRTVSERRSQIRGLGASIDNDFNHQRSWQGVMAGALNGGYVTVEVATAPIPLAGIVAGAVAPNKGSSATAAVTQIDGIYCAVLTTDSWQQADPELTVDTVKDIVDPRNWASLNSFFCEMDALPPDVNGASQVLEHVSTAKDIYQLKTALKNWKQNFGDGAILNYELADKRAGTGDSSLVLADNGYIHISQNRLDDGTVKGVRIRTSKMVAIEGSSVTAIAMFALKLGWAAVGNAMLFDNALNPPTSLPDGQPLYKWSTNPESSTGASGAGAAQGQAQSPPPQMPAEAGGALVREAVRMWARCVGDTTKTTSDIMNKWYKGQLTVADLVKYSTELGGRLASEPWRYLEDISNRSPATAPSQSTTQNTNKGGSS